MGGIQRRNIDIFVGNAVYKSATLHALGVQAKKKRANMRHARTTRTDFASNVWQPRRVVASRHPIGSEHPISERPEAGA